MLGKYKPEFIVERNPSFRDKGVWYYRVYKWSWLYGYVTEGSFKTPKEAFDYVDKRSKK